MKTLPKFISAAVLIAAAVAVCAPAPNAGSEHFVIVNDNDTTGNNYGTVLKLEGTKKNPALNQMASLATGAASWFTESVTPTVQIVKQESDVCVFLSESDENGNGLISAFKYPDRTLVGNYANSTADGRLGVALVATGGYLFAAYGGGNYMGPSLVTWQIAPGCTLTMLQSLQFTNRVFSLAATPDGKTLVASEIGVSGCCADSFSIGTGGVLTEHGPYGISGKLPDGIDVTADGKFALVDVEGFGPPYDDGDTEIDVLAINSDGSLGKEYAFGGDNSLGDADSGGWIRLSPNEKFLFVTDGAEDLTTLNFSETPVNVTWSGCLTTLRVPQGQTALSGSSIATAGTGGAGGGIYVSEAAQFAGNIAFLAVNPTTGCTTEEKQSPLTLNDPNAEPWSLVAWPPRLF